MSYCRIHGYYPDWADGCLTCQQDKEANQQSLDAIASRDFGDYVCPHCHYKTLRRDAKRCPLCHADPGPKLWARVDSEERAKKSAAKEAAVAAAERERQRKIQQAEEWEREAPARAAAAHRQAAAVRIQDASHRAKSFFLIYMSYFGPMLFSAIPTYIAGAPNRAGRSETFLLFYPVLNWLFLLRAAQPHSSEPIWYSLIGLLACGVVARALWALLRADYSGTLKRLICGAVVVITILLVMGRSFSPLGE